MKLAKLLKGQGYRQDLASGTGLVRVEWQPSVREAMRRLEKNAYATADYRIGPLAAGSSLLVLTGVLPYVGVVVARGAARVACLANVATILAMYRRSGSEKPLLHAVPRPVNICLFVYAVLRSAYRAVSTGAVEWRGTRYPLEDLKRNVL